MEMAKGQGGETVYTHPVSLEPPYEPFRHEVKTPSILEKLFQKQTSKPAISPVSPTPVTCIQIRPSQDDNGDIRIAEHMLTAMQFHSPASFEIIGNCKAIGIQITVHPEDTQGVIGVVSASNPSAEVFEGEDILKTVFKSSSSIIHAYKLKESFFFPLHSEKRRAEPYTTLFGIMSGLHQDEIGVLQVLFFPVQHDWKSNILLASRSEFDPSASPFYDLPQLPKVAEEKTQSPLFCCSVRVIASSLQVVHRLERFFNQFNKTNHFIKIDQALPPDSILERTNHASGIILNVQELSGLVHIPAPEAILPTVLKARRSAPAPDRTDSTDGIIFGENSHRGKSGNVMISKDWLTRHILCLGATGSGKTVWQANFFQQFIQHHGAIYIDPSGDSAMAFLKLIPPHRIKDTIYIDPCDPRYAPAFNMLDKVNGSDPDLIRGSVLTAFRRLFAPDGIGARSEWLLSNAVSTLIKSSHHPKTLLDIPRLFTDSQFRTAVIASVTDPQVLHFWKAEYEKLPESAILPLLNKLHAFLGYEKIRSMLCQSGKIDLDQIIKEKKVVVINLAKGLLGESTAATLGFLFLSAIQQTVMGLAKIPPKERDYFALILDEAHLFLSKENADTMNSLLSESRKYRWLNVIGTQILAAIDPRVRDALLGNVGTLLCFRIGVDDARVLQKEFGPFTADDLLNLMPGEAIIRLGRSQDSFNLKTNFIDLEALPNGHINEIIERSRDLYYTPRAETSTVHPPAHPSLQGPVKPIRTANPQSQTISTQEKAFLECVFRHPAVSVTGLYKQQGLSGYMGDKLKSELTKKGYTREITTHLGQRARIAKFLLLTQEGFDALGINYNAEDGKGGTLHRYWQSVIKIHAQGKGYEVSVEEPIPSTNEAVDLGLSQNGKRIAVEISVTSSAKLEMNNISKCLKANYDKVIVFTLEEAKMLEIQNLIKKVLSSEEQEKVATGLIYDFDRFF